MNIREIHLDNLLETIAYHIENRRVLDDQTIELVDRILFGYENRKAPKRVSFAGIILWKEWYSSICYATLSFFCLDLSSVSALFASFHSPKSVCIGIAPIPL